ncbi:MAG: spermidine synthase [Acidimicrobiia bacterium]|nr:spermidine synthase [Acidimicrobiia bacterium]MDH5504706.1 spermidine synthase [Acidimicrobiia bacterium]
MSAVQEVSNLRLWFASTMSDHSSERGYLSPKIKLVLLSFLMLFVELAMIRWLGENVVSLSFFSNFVLLGSFLGIGIGFMLAGRDFDLFRWFPLGLFGLIAFVIIFPVEIDLSGADLIYFGSVGTTGPPSWVTLPVIFAGSAAVMAMIGQGVGKQFALFEALEAYRLDILGSILGILGFSLLSLLSLPPLGWGIGVAVVTVLVLDKPRDRRMLILLGGLVIVLGAQTFTPGESWSPYYRVSVVPVSAGSAINVNGIPHQVVVDIDERLAAEPIYARPYEIISGPPSNVLIVGAGTGTDVATALRHGAERVVAVEIDPRLYELGMQLNPNRPYDDPRVDVVIDDGRAYLQSSEEQFDLVIFALPDSLTLLPGQSGLRLESYLFTEEAMVAAEKRTAVGGSFVMYNYYREDWLIGRLAETLEHAFGGLPCVESVGGAGRLALLAVGGDLGCDPVTLEGLAATANPVTDDAPFLYLRNPGLPGRYVVAIALILAVAVGSVRWAAGSLRTIRPYFDLFLMGAAFLLLETKNVVQFALLFGTTWFVNSLVFLGVLISVYLAIEAAKRWPATNPRALYVTLFAMMALAWLVPPGTLLAMPALLRFAAAVTLAFAPIFLANLVFANRFRDTASSTVAFGANLLGAMVGGVLEYASLIVGYRALLIVAALLYAGAYVSGRRYFGAPNAGSLVGTAPGT